MYISTIVLLFMFNAIKFKANKLYHFYNTHNKYKNLGKLVRV